MTSTATYPPFEPGDSAGRLEAIIPDHLCVGAQADRFLYGGSGFAAAIAAMDLKFAPGLTA